MTYLWAFISISNYDINTCFSCPDANAHPYLVRVGSDNQTENVQFEIRQSDGQCAI